MELRQLAPEADLRVAPGAAISSREATMRKGDSKRMRVSSRAAKRAYQRERSPWRDGGNPRNENGMAGKPEMERMAATAEGPAIGSTR